MSRAADARGGLAFVGRVDELRAVRAALDSAIRGEGSGVLVVGDAGIGKTRLVGEASSGVRDDGVRVVWASAWEHGGGPAHWHWIQVLRALAADRERSALIDDLGGEAVELARLVPEIRSGVGLPVPPQPEGEDPRFRLYDAVASFLRGVSQRQPLLLVLEDLHASDLATLRLLRFVLDETRLDQLAVVATTRDPDSDPIGDELAAALVDLGRTAVRMRLAGLARDEVEELLRGMVTPPDADRLAGELHRRSGGNPLFVGELAHLVQRDPATAARQPVPATIRSLLERRLTAVPAAAREVLRAAAVVGEEFTVPLVAEAAGVPRDQVLNALDDGLRAQVITGRPGAAFAFTHALVREVLYEQLSLPARAAAHRRVAEALERQRPDDPPLAELAHHFLAGAVAVEDGKAPAYAERAGHRAVAQFAYEDAAVHFRAALSALDFAGADQSRRIPLLLALGDAALRSGDMAAARDAFVQAAADARRDQRPDLVARAALGLGSGVDGFEVRLFDHAQITLLQEALATLDPEPSSLRSQALARLSVASTFAETQARRLELADAAVAMADTLGDAAALAYALAARCDATAGPEHIDQRLDAATEIARLALSAGDRGMELLGRRNRVIALLERGDIAGVDAEIDRYELVASGIGQPLYQWYVPLWRGMRALMDGRIDASRAYREEAAAVGARARSHNAALNTDVLAWNALLKEGRWEEAADGLARQLELADGIYGERFWVAIVTPEIHRTEAKAALDRFVASHFAELPRDAVWLAAMTYAADTCRVIGHRGAAEQLYGLILPHRSRFAVDAIGAACYGSMARPLGVVAAVLGRSADATAHFDEALDAHRSCGATALAAETLHDFGIALRGFGDERRAEAALDEARALYQSLGMHRRAALVPWTPALASPAATQTGNVFRLDGDYWTISYGGSTTRVADAKGLRDIAALLARPGREMHVADLIAANQPASDAVETHVREAVLRTSSDMVLDDRAQAAYRQRLLDLREELDEAEANLDSGRAAAARAEMDAIAGELATALGLGGRSRTHADAAERARKAVTQRIRNSLRRLARVHPELAAHLDRSVRTGRFCCYRPERSVEWSVMTGSG